MATYIKVSIGWATENNERVSYGLLGGLNGEGEALGLAYAGGYIRRFGPADGLDGSSAFNDV